MAIFEGALVGQRLAPVGARRAISPARQTAHCLGPLVPDLVIADQPLNDLGHDAGFVFPDEIAIEFSLVDLLLVRRLTANSTPRISTANSRCRS
jgi:hypothetical protein